MYNITIVTSLNHKSVLIYAFGPDQAQFVFPTQINHTQPYLEANQDPPLQLTTFMPAQTNQAHFSSF